ncbi:DUF1569 domain-containing protein [Flavobacterium sp.]|uniref:DUF1569 domain-containing protein n=1 Tax=Flavobacterium sp. TaxID=239 RepID=UPI0037536E15
MKQLHQLIYQLESKIELHDKINPSVSTSTIGWQIEHSFITIYKVVNVVKNSNPKEYKWKFNKNKILISILGFFPRGKANAPKIVLPDEIITKESIKSSLEKVKTTLVEWDSLDKNAHFQHPFFGNLNKKSTMWFLNMHTKHHLKIVNDICNKN